MPQHISRIEAWALNMVERVRTARAVEDARVELKREWPQGYKAARRIAAQANASFGSDALWIIGVDESDGVVGVQHEELATWWPTVASHFDGVTPSFIDIALSVEGKTIVCLLFDTNRPPYVVKNPMFGSSGGGAVSLEVPWREGTSVRTATRNDLVRMLVPTASLPEIEILGGSGTMELKTKNALESVDGYLLNFSVKIYLIPKSAAPLTIPFHRCRCVLSQLEGGDALEDFKFTMYRPTSISARGGSPDTVTMERTSSELIATGPGKCTINVSTLLKEDPGLTANGRLALRIMLSVVNAELPAEIELIAELDTVEPQKTKWNLCDRTRPADGNKERAAEEYG